MLECHPLQTHLCNGRRLLQQGSTQDECCEILPIRESCEPQGPRRLCELSVVLTWRTKCPTSGQKYALEFDIKYAGVMGIAFNLSTLLHHRWNVSMDRTEAVGKTDLLSMYQTRETVSSTLHAPLNGSRLHQNAKRM